MMPGHGEWNVNGTTCHARRLLLNGDAVASRSAAGAGALNSKFLQMIRIAPSI